MPDDQDRPYLYPVADDNGPYLRKSTFYPEHRRLEDRIANLEKDRDEHARDHIEEAKWRIRLYVSSIAAPIMVMVLGGLALWIITR